MYSYPNVLFVNEVESIETRHNKDCYFRTFANETPVFIILSHLREIPRLPLGWDLPLPFQDPFYAKKKCCSIINLAYSIINQQSDSWLFHFTYTSMYMYTVSQKKGATFIFAITLANVNQF